MTHQPLPPPRNYQSHVRAVIRPDIGFAHAAVMRPGLGFEVIADSDTWVRLRATEDGIEVALSIHRDGLPALIAELQRQS